MTICDLEGNLKHYIYGRKWDDRTQNRFDFYRKVIFYKDKIVALYFDGGDSFNRDKNGRIIDGYTFPTKFIVFDINGDYIKTIETGYKIVDYCYDQDHNRMILISCSLRKPQTAINQKNNHKKVWLFLMEIVSLRPKTLQN
jgi:hypothetical protein